MFQHNFQFSVTKTSTTFELARKAALREAEAALAAQTALCDYVAKAAHAFTVARI